MVKSIVIFIFLALGVLRADVYEQNCVKCHEGMSVGLDRFFYNYLLVYSGETDVKNAIISYLNYPAKETSVMSDEYLMTYKIKQKTTLNKEELKKAVDIYWEKYKVFGKLK
jgi:hypothetical protein